MAKDAKVKGSRQEDCIVGAAKTYIITDLVIRSGLVDNSSTDLGLNQFKFQPLIAKIWCESSFPKRRSKTTTIESK